MALTTKYLSIAHCWKVATEVLQPFYGVSVPEGGGREVSVPDMANSWNWTNWPQHLTGPVNSVMATLKGGNYGDTDLQ